MATQILLPSVGAQTALLECISWGLLDCENFNCPLFVLSGGCGFLSVYLQTVGQLMTLSCAYCCFLPLTFMASKVNVERLITGVELTEC